MRDSCPEVVTAVTDLRSFRPRNADCGPPTDFNLCATERGYSIETARHATANALMSDAKQVRNEIQDHETDLRLTRAPLHTRSDSAVFRTQRSEPPSRQGRQGQSRSGSEGLCPLGSIMLVVEDHDEHVRGTNAIELDSLCSETWRAWRLGG
jgi:hypothetical protein